MLDTKFSPELGLKQALLFSSAIKYGFLDGYHSLLRGFDSLS